MTTPSMIPSRDSNPFATCWTRPGALPFLATGGVSVEACVAQLMSSDWRGQILGPHGSGKSTLLKAIGREIESLGTPVRWIRGGRDFAPPSDPAVRGRVCLIDSFEQLSCWRRRQWRRRGWGVVATSHSTAGLPTLASLSPSFNDLTCCFNRLTRDHETSVTLADLRHAFGRHGANAREIWFDLYDRHEQRRREPSRLDFVQEPGKGLSRACGGPA
ncbi:hypothetical protein KOR34_13050 [Posidoniimonas corsicana]|uniref:AAA+ ATPase domain-containing protein n=2 Tax=Posidoniimonas corsicana TaxID=1938618 RepID=A0A5C5VET7_9BACT|nr:hypothetical protein KOR34_13050 [Posidoniimonas corsicana]